MLVIFRFFENHPLDDSVAPGTLVRLSVVAYSRGQHLPPLSGGIDQLS